LHCKPASKAGHVQNHFYFGLYSHHIYVFWRAASVPFVARHLPRKILILTGVIIWTVFFFGRVIGHGAAGVLAGALEFVGMNWMGVLFLAFICILAEDRDVSISSSDSSITTIHVRSLSIHPRLQFLPGF